MDNALLQEIVKLFTFALFVEATVEMLKDVKLMRQKDKGALMRMAAFALAYVFCLGFDYGVISRIIEAGAKERGWAIYLDYIGTSALITRGARWVYDKLATIEAEREAAKALAVQKVAKLNGECK